MKKIITVLATTAAFFSVALPAFANDDEQTAAQAQEFLWDTTPSELKVDVDDFGQPIVDAPVQAAANLGGEVGEAVIDVGRIVFSPIMALGYALNGAARLDGKQFLEGLFLIPASPVMKTGAAVGHRIAEYGSDAVNYGMSRLEATSQALGNSPNTYQEHTFYSIPATRIGLPGLNVDRVTDTVGIDLCTTCSSDDAPDSSSPGGLGREQTAN
jgi:hypothetical protein